MSDDQYRQIIRRFETLSGRFDQLEEKVESLQCEVHDIRELRAQLRDDDVVQRQAIANLAKRMDAVEARL